MRKDHILVTTFLACLSAGTLSAESPVKIGILFGFTGPIESMAPQIATSAELALNEASASGLFLGGRRIEPVRADSTCIDSAIAVSAAERLASDDQLSAIVGAGCSGAAAAVVTSVARPHGIISISPTATSPTLSTLPDDGLFFRTATSDARQGEVLARLLMEKDIRSIAVTYTSNDYGAGLSDAFAHAYEQLGGEVLIAVAHTDGKSDYSAEVATLAASGAELLLIAGYADQGGRAIVQASLDTGAFDRFVLPDGMVAQSLVEEFGPDLAGSIGTFPGGSSSQAERFEALLQARGIEGQAPFRAEGYDAAALLILAMQAAGTSDRGQFAELILPVANAPGVGIGPGEIAKGLRILSEGGEINYEGASAVELNESGDANGSYQEVIFSEDGFEVVNVW
ncbi:ABC transporter substrate-binding protein [Ruegeria sp. 2205SS24-7]|uniref:ABC transporter substrate-binding protein n=1 Tax=Ruegeria discodermiae TaxID=3064389 RepID=UPI0027410F12|nr:ABC transporter substrate-binding protein [Ruegeria sp. 2205SS24-7]MDP5220975.1 ABC transporter substrate-binding protein [Ruegeria sp. 2205SS24-7]